MMQPFAEALAWVPKSRALGATLSRAHDLARAQNQPGVSLEHLLLALIEDPDASAVLLSCNIDLLKLNAAASEYVQAQPGGASEMPGATPALKTILEYAVAAARQSRRSEINGAIVLAAIIGEGKSEAAKLLLASGLKFEDTVAALRRATSAQRPAQVDAPASQVPAQTGGAVAASEAAAAASGAAADQPKLDATAAPAVLPAGQRTAVAAPQVLAATPSPEDPVQLARLRIAAIRSGQEPSLVSGAASHASMGAQSALSEGNAAVAMLPGAATPREDSHPAKGSETSNWVPPPLPQQGVQAPRPVRLPPPVPPVAEAPVRRSGAAVVPGQAAKVPWADATSPTSTPDGAVGRPFSGKPPIDPERLAEYIPERMQAKTPITVEIRVPKGAVIATAAAANAQAAHSRSSILTRALSVRLRAPAGGFYIENAAPETQWFDSQSTLKDDDEVRWRWIVTPHARARLPLQLSCSMRTVAADGMIIETMLPEQQVSVKVGGNPRAALGNWSSWAVAALVGSVLTLLGSVGLAGLLGRVWN